MSELAFTELVQLHERKWGTTNYPGRPTLDQLLNAYIVVMWKVGKRFIFSVHQEAQEVNDLVFRLVTGQPEDPFNRKLAHIFVNREPIDFRIKIVSAARPDVPAPHRLEEPRPGRSVAEVINKRAEPQVVAVLPTPKPAFIIPDPTPISRKEPKPLHYGDLVSNNKPPIVSPMPENRGIYVQPRRVPSFAKTLDARVRKEIEKRIK